MLSAVLLFMRGSELSSIYVGASEVTNNLCQGCAVLIETAHHKIVHHDKHGKPGTELQLGEWLDRHCSSIEFKVYNSQVVKACSELKKHHVAIARPFKQKKFNKFVEPTPRNLYQRTLQLCNRQFKHCGRAADPPLTFQSDRCAQCKSLASDINDIMNRKSEWSKYRSRAHAGNVVEATCIDLPMRFSWPAARKLQAFCDDMVEEYEDEIITAAVSAATETEMIAQTCGTITKSCSKKELMDVESIWRSPFHATNVPTPISAGKERGNGNDAGIDTTRADQANIGVDDVDDEPASKDGSSEL
jgi:hypothetical protein